MSPPQGDGFGFQVRVIDLNDRPLLGTISEHCVKLACRAPYCVTKLGEGDNMMKTGKGNGRLGIFIYLFFWANVVYTITPEVKALAQTQPGFSSVQTKNMASPK